MDRNLILPGNLRYQPEQLKPYFGYDNLYRGLAEVELAVIDIMYEIGIVPEDDYDQLTPEIRQKILDISTTAVDKTEREITKHDVRAWVIEAQKIISGSLSRWVHVPLTSYDVLDTGRSLLFCRAYQNALRPSIKEMLEQISLLVEKHKDMVQIGRTHGQAALPITVGFWLATILSRIMVNVTKMERYANQISGKISGAVGAYNAQVALGIEENCKQSFGRNFEEVLLGHIGLKPARISTQILPPEPLAYFLFSATSLSATLGQFGRDCRHLMRTEIGEVSEAFEENQVGSSTMAHKRNPVSYENSEGMYIRTKGEFVKVLDTLISEHQRDLTGSAPARDFPIILVNLQQQLNTLLRKNKEGISFIARISVSEEACKKNFEASQNLILAEPLYIALQMAGYEGDAHHLVSHKLVPIAIERDILLIEALNEYLAESDDIALKEAFDNIPPEIYNLLFQPKQYIGRASEKAMEIVDEAKKFAETL